jgi:hypothetical protein
VTVSCEFFSSLDDLSELGVVARNQAPYNETRENRTLFDSTGVGSFSVFDGIAQDNCGLEVTEVILEDVECGLGEIERTFIATDQSGNSNECVQLISVIDFNPFTGR